MTHKQILQALSGLLLAMFAAMVASTIVNTALPPIVADLGGSQTGYTWVVVGTLLAMTATTPVWGKLADLFDQKFLTQLALGIFAFGSLVAGFANSMETLIGARVIQGLGIGGLVALVQVVIASMVSPRERGRYAGYTGAVFAVATVSGPLIGGLVVDTLGWRWCFWVSLPFAVAAWFLLQRTLKLPPRPRREVAIDYVGAFLIMSGVSLLLVWISLAGKSFDWVSGVSFAVLGASLAALALAIWYEAMVAVDPVIPLRLFRDRTTTLATLASITVGIAMFGSGVYLAQYFQLARGMSPTLAGLMSICMVFGTLVSGIVTGRLIADTGRWKRYLVGGAVLVILGLGLLGTIDRDTPLALTGLYMAVLGVGVGGIQQNLLLPVQNNAAFADMGAASSLVAFFRSIGGSAGVAALGAVLAHQVAGDVRAGLGALGVDAGAGRADSVPDLAALPEPVRLVFENAYGDGIATIFALAVPCAIASLVCILFIKEVPLRRTVERDDEISEGQSVSAAAK